MSGFCSTAVVACFVLGGSIAFAQTSYKVTDLGVLPSKEESVPAAISRQGLVAGTSIAEPSGEAAFRYNPNNPAPMEDIGLSSRGVISRGFGINNIGMVVGDSAFVATNTGASPVRHATLFGDGSRIDPAGMRISTGRRQPSFSGTSRPTRQRSA